MASLFTPLVFEPLLVEKIWGGSRLESLIRRTSSGVRYGEAWCLSPLATRSNLVRMGPLAGRCLEQALGAWATMDPGLPRQFPVLVKMLESTAPLSVQVHPSTEIARNHGDGPVGKAEAWLILDADPDTRILHGLAEDVTPEGLERILRQDPSKVVDICRQLAVAPGDVVPIPPGVVHTILGRMVWVEVQQACDITYRLYDWGRTGLDRRLHPEKSLASMRYGRQPAAPLRPLPTGDAGRELLWASPWFSMEKVIQPPGRPIVAEHALEAWLCLGNEGSIQVDGELLEVRPGLSFVLARGRSSMTPRGEAPMELLRVHVEDPARGLVPALERAGASREQILDSVYPPDRVPAAT